MISEETSFAKPGPPETCGLLLELVVLPVFFRTLCLSHGMMPLYREIAVDVEGSGRRIFRRDSESRDYDARIYRIMRNDPIHIFLSEPDGTNVALAVVRLADKREDVDEELGRVPLAPFGCGVVRRESVVPVMPTLAA